MKMTALWLDDIRKPPDDNTWLWFDSAAGAKSYINRHGCPSLLSLDHDLGEGDSGYDFLKWLVGKHIDEGDVIPEDCVIRCHSANPVGRENIEKHFKWVIEQLKKENEDE